MSHSMAIPSRNKRKARSSPEWENQPQPQPPSSNPDSDIPSSSSSVADNFSSPSKKPLVFPPGYRFTPTNEELILYYLNPFSQGKRSMLLNVPIHHVNIYEFNPQQLSEKYKKANEKEWFFITERTKLCEGGKNNKRCVNGGYWKKTVTPEKINAGHGVVGYMSLLNFYVGKQPNGVKGDWLMQEYYFESSSPHNNDKVDHALCKIYLTPTAEKKKKKEEKEKLKEEENIAIVDVEQSRVVEYEQQPQPQFSLAPLDSHQPDQPQSCLLPQVSHQSQPQNYVDVPQQQSAEHQIPQPHLLSFQFNLDIFSEMMSLEQPPDTLESFDDILTNFYTSHSLESFGDEESNTSDLFDDFIMQGMETHCTT